MDSAVVKNDGERSTSIYNSRSFPDNLREVYQVRSSHHDLLFSIADVTLIRINNNIRLSRITFAEDGSWATRRLSRLKRCSSPTVLLEHATIVSSQIISWRRIESYKRPRFNLHRGPACLSHSTGTYGFFAERSTILESPVVDTGTKQKSRYGVRAWFHVMLDYIWLRARDAA